jgi:hypothetical protein
MTTPSQPVDDLIIACSCSSLGHVVRFSSWHNGEGLPVDIYLHVSIDRTESFWRRAGYVWRYLMGRGVCNYLDATEVSVDPEDVPRIQAWLEKAREP